MASITSWVRLEPRSRDADLLVGVDARLQDPLWLLARQWQLGELTGVDAGSAVTARARLEVARVDAWRAGDGAWQPFDPDTTPLVAVQARGRDERTARPPLRRRARTGRHLLRLLGAAGYGGYDSIFVGSYPLTISDAERVALDDADLRFASVLGRRVPDGDAAAAALRPMLAAGDLPAEFGVAPGDVHGVSEVCRAWLGWLDAFEQITDTPGWRPDRLAYSFEMRAGGDHLVASDRRGDLCWYDLDAVNAAASAALERPAPVVSTSLPTHVRYRGMPARRYWELEDAAVHWPSIDAGPGDVGRLLFVEFGLTLADGWLQIPIAFPAGAVARASSLVVTDTFGIRTLVRSASEIDGQESAWRFLGLSGSSATVGSLVFIPPTAVHVAGRTVEAIDFALDDTGNALWAVDRTICGSDGRSREVVATPQLALTLTAPTYRLGPTVDPMFHPYRPRDDTSEFTLAAIPGQPTTARPDLPVRVRAHALLNRATRLAASAHLVRASDGRYRLVMRHETSPAQPPASPSLTFDVVEETP